MSWKRSTLASTGFFYDENSKDWDGLPRHVKSLQQSMLNFECQEFDSVPEEVLEIQKEALQLVNDEKNEVHFEYFFQRCFFDPLRRHGKGSDKHPPNPRYTPDYDAIAVDFDIQWGAFGKRKDRLFKAPKPDLAFFIPLYHPDASANVPTGTGGADEERYNGSITSLVETFSWSTLKKLHKNGLRVTPFDDFKIKIPKGKHLRCYPWLVVEYKKTKESKSAGLERLKEVVYCQAANASGCAVRLNQNAAKFAPQEAEDTQIPPVPAITTVGAEVKVWVTYLARDFMAYRSITNRIQRYERVEKGYMMQCIWTGDMTKKDDILKFRAILKNTSTWGTRVFRPMMAKFINQWQIMCNPVSTQPAIIHQQERMELSRGVLQMVNRVLSAQPHLVGGEGSHEAIKTSLINLCDSFIRDVDRVIEDKVQSPELLNHHSSCPTPSFQGVHIPNNRVNQSILLGGKKPDPDDLDVLRCRRPKFADSMTSGQIKASRETPDPLSYALPFIVGSSQQERVPITRVGASPLARRLGVLVGSQHQRTKSESLKVARKSIENMDTERVLKGS